MTLNSLKQYVPKPTSCSYGRYIKISRASAQKRRVTFRDNPCSAFATLCQEPTCKVPFWTISGKDHYQNHHGGTECPATLQVPDSEFEEIRNPKYRTHVKYMISEMKKKKSANEGTKTQRKKSFHEPKPTKKAKKKSDNEGIKPTTKISLRKPKRTNKKTKQNPTQRKTG